MNFYSISHNSFDGVYIPWIQSVVHGLFEREQCTVCGITPNEPDGDLDVRLEGKETRSWPDALGCGAYPLLVVSDRSLSAWRDDGIEAYVGGSINVVGPMPIGLSSTTMPAYQWIDGRRHRAATLDFEASGYIGVRFCPKCGNRTHNIRETYKRQQSGAWPYQLRERSWSGKDLFTTDLSPTAFFCTRKVVDSIARAQLTNFRLVPLEEGADGEPLDYLR